MKTKVGCDIVFLKKFQESLTQGGDSFLQKVFSAHELHQNKSTESLAGIFAAKEAVMKAFDMEAGSWQKIEISKSETGRPVLKVEGMDLKRSDVSISHDGEYVVAVTVVVEK